MAGESWTPELQTAWEDALRIMTDVMLKSYRTAEDSNMAVKKRAAASGLAKREFSSIVEDLTVLQDVLEHAPVNIMIADADENIVFMNKRSTDVLTALEAELAKHMPGFRADRIVGGSIHRFHKDPRPSNRYCAI